MGSLKQKLRRMEREAFRHAVTSECRLVCYLFGMESAAEIAAVEEEALALIADPTLPPHLPPDEIERGRQDMYGAAMERGVPLEDCKAEIDALVDSLIAAVEAQRG